MVEVGRGGFSEAGIGAVYLRVRLRLLVIFGLFLGLKNVIYQLSDPTKGKPPVQISKQHCDWNIQEQGRGRGIVGKTIWPDRALRRRALDNRSGTNS